MIDDMSKRSSEHGAVLVHTALALLALMAFSVFAIDYGVLLTSRRQAQNAADAAALSGAMTLAFDDSTLGPSGAAYETAEEVVKLHRVWGQIPGYRILVGNTNATVDDPCPTWEAAGVACVRADVHRDGTLGSTQLPMFFGHLIGLTQQPVRATATARVTGANTVRCILPLVLADRWADMYDDNIQTGVFANDGLSGTAGWTSNDHYQPAQGDFYNAPYQSNSTGWTVTGDFGRQLVLHEPVGHYSAGWSGIVDLPNDNGGNDWRTNLWDCTTNVYSVGIAAENEDCSGYSASSTTVAQAQAGCLGIKTGLMPTPTQQGIGTTGPGGGPVPNPVLSQDPGARWVPNFNGTGRGAVVDASGNLNMDSPRIRPVPVIDINHYMANVSGCSGSGCVVKISNIVGFFVEGTCDDVSAANGLDFGVNCDPDTNPTGQVVGRIVTLPGSFVTGNGAPITASTFVKTVQLIR